LFSYFVWFWLPVGLLLCPNAGRRGHRSSVQEKNRDCGDNAQRDENERRDPHANREATGKRGLTGWDSHEPREPVIELHICRLIRSFVALDRLSVAFPASPPAECVKHSCRQFGSAIDHDRLFDNRISVGPHGGQKFPQQFA
jgi:hypothetical protein